MQERSETTGLLKYDSPVAVDESDKPKKTTAAVTSGVDGDSLNREVIDSIFPPVEFEEGGVKYKQSVSTTPVAKADVVKLKNQLETLLHQQKARPKGICPIRSNLYSQCFDEIIRQVLIDNNARGRLLVRVREHFKSLIQDYKDIDELALEFGSNKSLQVNQGVPELQQYNKELKERRRTLELEVNDLQIQLDALERRFQENKQIREKEHADEVAFLKKQGQLLKTHYDSCSSRPP